MKKFLLTLAAGYLILPAATAQVDLNKIKKTVTTTSKPKSLSNDEVVRGLREALTVGTNNSASIASKVDGYYKNTSIKIPFPPEAKIMDQKLRNLGMGQQVDRFVLTLNRAAEDAAKQAAPIFVNAIKSMTIADGMSILKGGDNAATTFLKNNTSANLRTQFKPVIKASLQKVEVTKYWNPLMTTYNKIPGVKKMNPNLEDYVTQKAIDGLFHLIGQEELKIRKDPLARITDLLKKVFG
jgi:hypothetical protein